MRTKRAFVLGVDFSESACARATHTAALMSSQAGRVVPLCRPRNALERMVAANVRNFRDWLYPECHQAQMIRWLVQDTIDWVDPPQCTLNTAQGFNPQRLLQYFAAEKSYRTVRCCFPCHSIHSLAVPKRPKRVRKQAG